MLKEIYKVGAEWRKIMLNLGIVLGCLTIFSFMPTGDFSQEVTKSLFFLFLIPLIYIKYILKKDFSHFGFNLGNKKIGFFSAGLALIISLLTIYLLTIYTSFSQNYALTFGLSQSFMFFLIYQLVLLNVPLFFQEFFFKGFVIEMFREKLGYFSILFQAIIYLAPLFIISSNYWNIIPIVLVSVFGGISAYLSRSFFYSYLFAIIFNILMDAFLISSIK